MKKLLIFIALIICLLTISTYAVDKISPAIDVLASENGMIKAGISNGGEIYFDALDFDMPTGANVKQITICSLPDSSEGRLMLDNLYVVENQVIYREDFSMLKYVSLNDSSGAFFSFEPNNCGYAIECSLVPMESVNLSPVASNGNIISAWTQENISYYGTLSGYDPEGDSLKYEIISYPKKGLLNVSNILTGDYVYTPFNGAKGADAFTYVVRDSYGKYSEECTVSLKIEKLRTSLVFEDFENERYLNASLIVTDFGIMDCEKSGEECAKFNPEQIVTREEFLVFVMKAMGVKNVPTIEKTRFADNEDINKDYRGYIEGALSLGIINGTIEADGLHFYPKKEITLSDAAVIINKILGAKADGLLPVFLDSEDIPEYAKDDISSLNKLGILTSIDGKINPNSVLTKAQVAQIILSLLEYSGKINK